MLPSQFPAPKSILLTKRGKGLPDCGINVELLLKIAPLLDEPTFTKASTEPIK